jgi:hypothetical protein
MADDPSTQQRYLKDRQEILDCVYLYCRALDRHDRELMARVFHPDAIDNHGEWVGRAPEAIVWSDASLAAAWLSHSHHVTCHFCEIEGEVAHTESYLISFRRHKDGKTVVVGGGRYIDRFERRDGEWRIALRREVSDWKFTADGSVFNIPDGFPQGTWDRTDLSYMRPLRLTPELEAQVKAKG